ncbi:MAG: response regulator [Zavarzinella sp.]
MVESVRYSILITDDDTGIREALAEICESQGFRPILAEHGEQAIDIVQHEPIHLALLDMNMPRMTGLELLQIVRQIHALLPAILITADANMELLRKAFEAQVYSVVPKPFEPTIIKSTVFRALAKVYGQPEEHDSNTNNKTEEKE